MEIRAISVSEGATLKAALDLVRNVFWDFEAPEYSDEGVLEFESYIAPAAIADEMRGHRLLMWGAFVRGQVIGVIAARPPCHVSLFFVARSFHGKGVGRALMAVLADFFREAGDPGPVTVNSSPFAVPVYQKLGFTPTSGEKTVNGIRFVPMVCPLGAAPTLSETG